MSLEANAQVFAEWFGIQHAPAMIVALMFEADGAVVSYADFEARIGSTQSGTVNAASRLRDTLEPEAFVAERCLGYRMTLIGLEDCRDALADAEKRRAA
jgi:hypothetical protein